MDRHNGGYHILRVGMGITFLWIGILIFKSPEAWGGYIQPWAADILLKFMSLKAAMIETAILDMVVGAMLLVGWRVWIAAGLGAGHIAIVIITVGINDVTVRDIAVLVAALSLFYDDLPVQIRHWFQRKLHIASI